MAKRFTRYKLRHQIQRVIQETAGQIAESERELAQARADFEGYRMIPNADALMLRLTENNIRAMEQNLTDFEAKHIQFVEEQAKPSALYPKGISV